MLEALDEKARGVNVAVLNQKTGAVMATRSFDTFGSQEDSDSLVSVSYTHLTLPTKLEV